jgi:hypothetical protein
MAHYIRATIEGKRGRREQVICEFQQKQGMRRFARDVMAGAKALPVWRVVGTEHPHSGERVLLRTRQFINGRIVLDMEEVEPVVEDHDYEPGNFTQAPSIRALNGSSRNGLWTAPVADEDRVEGAEPGAQYPVHRDVADSRRYVLLKAAGEFTPEVRHYLDAEAGHGESWRDAEDDAADLDFAEDDDY